VSVEQIISIPSIKYSVWGRQAMCDPYDIDSDCVCTQGNASVLLLLLIYIFLLLLLIYNI